MPRVEFSLEAVHDLEGIDEYTAATWGTAQAERYGEELDLALRRLSLSPDLGRSRNTTAPVLRSFPVAQHVAFYVHRKAKIIVLCILHRRMNVDETFGEGFWGRKGSN